MNNIDKILELHSEWLKDKDNGKQAVIKNKSLIGIYLDIVHLPRARLENVCMKGAYLINTDLRMSYLKNVDLRNSDIILSNLNSVVFDNVNLRGCAIQGSSFRHANLSDADLRGTTFEDVDLYRARLPKGFYVVNLGQHTMYAYKGYIRIGCEYKSVKNWLEEGKERAKYTSYSKEEIKDYYDFIKWYSRRV